MVPRLLLTDHVNAAHAVVECEYPILLLHFYPVRCMSSACHGEGLGGLSTACMQGHGMQCVCFAACAAHALYIEGSG
jgi:hypothetical protein